MPTSRTPPLSNVAHILSGVAIQEDTDLREQVTAWQKWILSLGRAGKIYCGMSVGILFFCACLIVSVEDGDGDSELTRKMLLYFPFDVTVHVQTDPLDLPAEFYFILLAFLCTIRCGLYYLATSLIKAITERCSAAMSFWVGMAIFFLTSEFLIIVLLFYCVPAVYPLVIFFLVIDGLMQGAMVWAAWNFKQVLEIYEREGFHVRAALAHIIV